ncbi:hypothetical protein BJX70DRAFT_409025 [Aspergillus crustosus]
MHMHFHPSTWLLAASAIAITLDTAAASGILEVDLVFPRNKTYAPEDFFPIVFAFQNPSLARYLNPHISYTISNENNRSTSIARSHDLRWTNWSTEQNLFFAYAYFSEFGSEGQGTWTVDWSLSWESCDEEAFSNIAYHPRARMISNSSSFGLSFSIGNAGEEVDLVSATAGQTCPGEQGVIISITDRTMQVPLQVDWAGSEATNDSCVVVETSTPTMTPDACRVEIDEAAAASMRTSLTATLCRGVNPPDDCPEIEDDENDAQRLAVLGASVLLGACGPLSFFRLWW